MTISIGQTSYSLYPPVAEPGLLADNEVNHIESFQAAEAIQCGRLLEVAADGISCQQVQNTEASATVPYVPSFGAQALGFSVLLTSREGLGSNNVVGSAQGAAFAAGDMVPVLRKGAMFAEWKGTTQTAYSSGSASSSKLNVYHSSTVATDRGKLTDAAPATTVGSEISPCPAGIQLRNTLPGSGNVALVNVNFPSSNVGF